MAYSITTRISTRKTSLLKQGLNVLILVLAIPVVLIGWLSMMLFDIMFFVRDLLTGRKDDQSPEYYEELSLIDRSSLKVILIEAETDDVLTDVNERWNEQVHGGDTYFYRVQTEPLIPGLHNTICSNFVLDVEGGALLQQLSSTDRASLDTSIVFLHYDDFSLHSVGAAGAFYLFINKENLIRGVNQTHKMDVDINPL